MERPAEDIEVLPFRIDHGIARKPGGEDAQGIVGGGITVNGEHIEGILDIRRDRLLQHLVRDGGVRREEHEHGRHVGADHADALADGAEPDLFVAEREGDGRLLSDGVCRHDGLGRKRAVRLVGGKPLYKLFHAARDGIDLELLPDDARGGDDDVACGDARVIFHEGAHLLGDLHAVCIAGVGVAAVDDDRPRIAVLDVLTRHEDGRTLDEVLRIDARRRTAHLARDEGKVLLDLILADAAVNAVRRESLGRTYAARNKLQHGNSPRTAEQGPKRP